jgi:diguanylate cyclase (GGDEF)-like protein
MKNIKKHLSPEKFEIIAKNVPGIIFRFKLSTKNEWSFEFLQGDYSFLEKLGIKPKEIMENSEIALSLIPQNDIEKLNATLYKSAETLSVFNWEGEFVTAYGSCWLRFSATPQLSTEDQSVNWYGLAIDITEQKKIQLQIQELNQALKIQAETDYLTGLYNRRKFISEVESELNRYERYKDSFCFAILDLDNFKSLNDTYGHDIGDMILKHFAIVLNTTLRKVDVYGRIGGEEFAILLTHATLEQGKVICQRIVNGEKALEDYSASHKKKIKYTCSIGITEVIPGDDFQSLFTRADELLYRAKAEGKDRLVAKI